MTVPGWLNHCVVNAAGSRQLYEARINAAMDFVEANLSQRLALEEVAGAASFSPFHFQRIFSAVVGETPAEHVRRVRTERAAALLVDQPSKTVSTIAANCGFGTPSAFARAFKSAFGVTPSQWRSGLPPAGVDSRPPLRSFPSTARIEVVGFREWAMTGDVPEASITVQLLDEVDLAYLRHTGPFQGSSELFDDLFQRLEQQTSPPGADPDQRVRHALYHDDPELTDQGQLRLSVAVPVGEGTRFGAGVGRLTTGAGLHVVARFELRAEDYGAAWKALLGGWLPASGYEPADGPYFERFPSLSSELVDTRIVEICVPVRPIST